MYELCTGRGTAKCIRKKKILQGITFEAHAGECIGIVGRNGCGKSTLLNILAGIYKPAAGSLFFDEKPGTPENIRKFTAYVPQNSNLYEELSVWDNLLFWYPDKRSLQNALKEGILQSLGIEEFLHKRVSHLSGGMKKKSALPVLWHKTRRCCCWMNPEPHWIWHPSRNCGLI